MHVADEGAVVGCTCDDMIGRARSSQQQIPASSPCANGRGWISLAAVTARELRSSLSREPHTCSLSGTRVHALYTAASSHCSDIALSRALTHDVLSRAASQQRAAPAAAPGGRQGQPSPASPSSSTQLRVITIDHGPFACPNIHRQRREIGKRPPQHPHDAREPPLQRAAHPAWFWRCLFTCLPCARSLAPALPCCAWPTLELTSPRAGA